MANRPRYQTVEVVDAEGLPRYITMQRMGESFVDMAWDCRAVVDNPLMRWLRSLIEPPKSRVLLGGGVQLTIPTARALVCFLRERVAHMAGSWPDKPDFGLWPATNRGGREHCRPVCRVRGEIVQQFASVQEAAQAIRSSRDDIEKRIESGHRDSEGWAWWECEAQTV